MHCKSSLCISLDTEKAIDYRGKSIFDKREAAGESIFDERKVS